MKRVEVIFHPFFLAITQRYTEKYRDTLRNFYILLLASFAKPPLRALRLKIVYGCYTKIHEEAQIYIMVFLFLN